MLRYLHLSCLSWAELRWGLFFFNGSSSYTCYYSCLLSAFLKTRFHHLFWAQAILRLEPSYSKSFSADLIRHIKTIRSSLNAALIWVEREKLDSPPFSWEAPLYFLCLLHLPFLLKLSFHGQQAAWPHLALTDCRRRRRLVRRTGWTSFLYLFIHLSSGEEEKIGLYETLGNGDGGSKNNNNNSHSDACFKSPTSH